jgi:hypothetical protein
VHPVNGSEIKTPELFSGGFLMKGLFKFGQSDTQCGLPGLLVSEHIAADDWDPLDLKDAYSGSRPHRANW